MMWWLLSRNEGGAVATAKMAWQALQNLRLHQAAALSYFDCFMIFAVLGFGLAFLVLLMKPSVAAKGAHIAAE